MVAPYDIARLLMYSTLFMDLGMSPLMLPVKTVVGPCLGLRLLVDMPTSLGMLDKVEVAFDFERVCWPVSLLGVARHVVAAWSSCSSTAVVFAAVVVF